MLFFIWKPIYIYIYIYIYIDLKYLTSLLWCPTFRCSVALMIPQRIRRVCYCCDGFLVTPQIYTYCYCYPFEGLHFTFMMSTFQMFSSTDESSKDKTDLGLLWDGLLATLHLLVCIYILNVLDAKMVLKTHLFIKIFRLLYRSFVSLIRTSRNIKQKSTQQLIQAN